MSDRYICGFPQAGTDGVAPAPLTTRAALADALSRRGWLDRVDAEDAAADLLENCPDALTDAGKLAEDEALVERVTREIDYEPTEYALADVRAVLAAIAAALAAQSERAEVER